MFFISKTVINSTLNVGLIGAGRIGRLHAEHLSNRIPNVKLLMVTDANESAARDCANQFQIPECGSDLQKLIQHPDIRAVVVCSPTNTHSAIIQAAAAARKHIFCEKPIDTDLRRIDEGVQRDRAAPSDGIGNRAVEGERAGGNWYVGSDGAG